VTKLTVYNHFQDKETLFTCAIELTCEQSMCANSLDLNEHSDFLIAFYQVCELALNIINLPEAIKLEHLLLQLAADKSPLALRFYNVSHERMCSVWQKFFQQAALFKFIQVDNIEKQINLILSLLLGIRHHEVLLGIRQPPTEQEKQYIINESIDLFMMKYRNA